MGRRKRSWAAPSPASPLYKYTAPSRGSSTGYTEAAVRRLLRSLLLFVNPPEPALFLSDRACKVRRRRPPPTHRSRPSMHASMIHPSSSLSSMPFRFLFCCKRQILYPLYITFPHAFSCGIMWGSDKKSQKFERSLTRNPLMHRRFENIHTHARSCCGCGKEVVDD